MKWEVTGAHRESGDERAVIIEADTEDSAKRRANRQGLLVSSLRCLDPDDSIAGGSIQPQPPRAVTIPPPTPAVASRRDTGGESLVWSGTPSQLVNLGTFIICGLLCWLIIPLLFAAMAYIRTSRTLYEITTQRIRLTSGILSRTSHDLELYRVRDTVLHQPFLLARVGLANLKVVSSDPSTPSVTLEAIPNAAELRETIRRCAEDLREKKGVRGYHAI